MESKKLEMHIKFAINVFSLLIACFKIDVQAFLLLDDSSLKTLGICNPDVRRKVLNTIFGWFIILIKLDRL